jgi:hypothetical protein
MRASKLRTVPKRLSLAVFVVGFAAVATVLLVNSRAATPVASFEAEAGTLSGDAAVVSDAGASAAQAVKFSTTTPSGTHPFPYSFTDAQFFSGVTTVAPFRIGCETRSNQSVIAHAEPAAIVNNCESGTSTINNIRLGGDLGANGDVREGYRCGGSGIMNIHNTWLESKGAGDDHADVIQCYDPNNSPTATMNISNTTIRAYNTAATAGLFVADSYSVDLHVTDSMFWGGPFGLRFHTDGRPGRLWMNNVCFYGVSSSSHSFGTAPILMNPTPPTIMEWNNVNWCTIDNGTLTVRGAIARP